MYFNYNFVSLIPKFLLSLFFKNFFKLHIHILNDYGMVALDKEGVWIRLRSKITCFFSFLF